MSEEDLIHYVLAGYRFIGVNKKVWIEFYEKYGISSYANIIKVPRRSNQQTVLELVAELNVDGCEALFEYTKEAVGDKEAMRDE